MKLLQNDGLLWMCVNEKDVSVVSVFFQPKTFMLKPKTHFSKFLVESASFRLFGIPPKSIKNV